MAYPITASLVALFLIAAPAAQAQGPAAAAVPAENLDTSLSPQCRVPGSSLYTLAPLRGVKRALRENRAVHVLAIGSSSTVGVGASSPQASYPARLAGELERLFPGIAIDVVNRGMSGESAAAAAERMRNAVAEVDPDLVIWQVGTNDALARVDVDGFRSTLADTVAWLKSHKVDTVIVDPQYTASLAKDEHYQSIVEAIGTVAREARVPLVRRYEAMRYLAGQPSNSGFLSGDRFHLNDLGYRCMAEHVARAVTVSLLQAESGPDQGAPEPPKQP
ncbi:MAG TPA: SGNH/GDSL hydrolase family protein [Beijerinckiaceae bacterium]|jgi:lysophospholipase L1-like esterase